MERQVSAVLIGAGQRGAQVYGEYSRKHPADIRFVAVAEPDSARRAAFAAAHSIAAENVAASWEEILSRPRMADCVFVCTQDNEHILPAMAALEQGYHVVMEKPMSRAAGELAKLRDKAKEKNRIVTVCHVLRYTPFFSKVKAMIEAGSVGDLQCIQMIENVAYWHQAHSFVRGNWRRADETSPMILAKSCHDMDILLWMAGSPCTHVASFGALRHFRAENAPPDAPAFCLDGCPHAADCPYDAERIYLQDEKAGESVVRKVLAADDTDASIRAALRTGPYGRCVYRCDNDVVDHQVVNLAFESGVSASFTMSAFTWGGGRTLNVMGSAGQIIGDVEGDCIKLVRFATGETTTCATNAAAQGHSGGDAAFMADVVRQMRSDGAYTGRTQVADSVESHLIALAAEQARVDRTVIALAEWQRGVN